MAPSSSLADWLNSFKKLHAKAARGQLGAGDGVVYYRGRNELARLLFGLQQLLLQPGQVPRQWIRIVHPLRVDLDFTATRVQAFTLDLSLGGFSTMLSLPPEKGEVVRYGLHLPGADPLHGQARVADVKERGGEHRTAFQFVALTEPDRERLEIFVFDVVLSKLA
jgi:hypothetical protein